MKINEIVQILDASVHNEHEDADCEVKSACAADLMSDVLAFSKSSTVLLTGLMNPQVIRTAEMMDIVCIVFVRNKKPTAEMLSLARELGIALLSTEYTMYYAAGKLYEAGLGKKNGNE